MHQRIQSSEIKNFTLIYRKKEKKYLGGVLLNIFQKPKLYTHFFSFAMLFTGMDLPKTKCVKVMREFYKFIHKSGRDYL